MADFSEKRLWSLMSDDEDEDRYPFEEPFHYQGKYLYDYSWYHENFPEEWLNSHNIDETGPKYCTNCEEYGCINGIFIGYCVNCAQHVYKGSRGRGFINIGMEAEYNTVVGDSVFETYLKNVDIWEIAPIIPETNEEPSEEIIDQKN